MTANNFERLKIVLSLNDPLDYNEFKTACENQKIVPLSPMEYAMKALMVLAGKQLFPELPEEESYMKVVKLKNLIEEMPVPQSYTEAKKSNGCGGCGGGKTR